MMRSDRPPPEMTPEKEDVLRIYPRSVLEICPPFVQNSLELLVVASVTHCLLWTSMSLLFLAYLYSIGFWYLPLAAAVAYLPTYFNGANDKVLPSQGGMQWDAFRRHGVWQLVCSYLKLECVREAPLDPTERYIFGVHPNSFSLFSGLVLCGGNFERLFPGLAARLLLPSSILSIPFVRELCLWLCGVAASSDATESALNNGLSVLIFPGGTDEALTSDSTDTDTTLVLEHHMEHIQLAFTQGASLVPTFVFGERWLYWSWPTPQTWPYWVRWIIKVPSLFLCARGRFGTWLPFLPSGKRKLAVVFGAPIPVHQKEDPTEDELRRVHAIYVDRLQKLFEAYKHDFGYADDDQIIIT
ncbi:Aste57867_9154 [Aphanomyces stellatus]|uniref:Acyltransferase n=1 Tax=Aphanomyces stellatus TaxID=120398 RepID=A0A485KMC9_9STRA|nr:hypothetical protein As57867_009118 [Aphanomyces stellatus]VFT86038.1 Aste57867_9154 [Aphanomyces stellatus]